MAGAGVNAQGHAYLVTELMSKGALKSLLRDTSLVLDWDLKLRFAADIASGMRYLHEQHTVHRDLKADNCFVDDGFRVKVADFGTGRIRRRMKSNDQQDGLKISRVGYANRGRTLSNGGSLLWMAPEALRGARLKDGQGQALDVYSYAIVLWEIWARARPWDEVKEEGVQFSARLTELVNAGVRPELPTGCDNAPEGYKSLMEQCWTGRPEQRPPFSSVLHSLTVARNNLAQ